ncbi:uncharacterized protein F4822DRAFT_428464 [Hypoxylon trugodes]|uniref:uncharacterized protein n=1 Tax=Hypoxylon trugodes TaxID=326681 RepID=UPI00219DA863|nr:uncharacterized protein F4822DRAFT_428464 [Hypoxylon trugodes]KAI1390122.1 hypothetical protein F4822DRAFT_428464 [Hypoxylon trugodes]
MSGQAWQRSNNPQRVADSAALRSASASGPPNQQRQRNDGKPNPFQSHEQILTASESWVEVASHPSSSSMSSIGDEIVTTGLQVGSSYDARRRRRLHPQSYGRTTDSRQPTVVAGQAGSNSSQEEYEESESEDDRVLTSSTENITSSQAVQSTPLRQAQLAESDSSDDDDDRATALGRRPSEPFQPQPNAFSHPPSHLTHRHSASSTIPQRHHRPSFGQRSQTRIDRRAPSFISPNYQADNDAALRASLTTLLSCAAAAGKRSKDGEKEVGERSNMAAGNQPVELRFAPESELMAPSPPPAQTRTASQSPRTSPPATTPREVVGEKVKRAATPTSAAKSPRATKKKRTNAASAEEALISPTLLTWVVSAGVVVLVSVVGFGAGYVIGREVGRQETLGGLGAMGNASAVSEGSNCGRDVIRTGGGTLRRFRWGTAVGRSITA